MNAFDSIKRAEREAYERGRRDFLRGRSKDENPFKGIGATDEYSEWAAGWDDEQTEAKML